jgi:integrase
MLRGITPDMVDIEHATVTVAPRHKGAGMPGKVLSTTTQAVGAFRLWLSTRAYEPWNPSMLRKAFKKAARAAGYPQARLYDLRHTFLTRVAQQFGIQAAMGLGIHANISTTQRYVNGAVQPLMAQAVEAMNLAAVPCSRPETPTNTVH